MTNRYNYPVAVSALPVTAVAWDALVGPLPDLSPIKRAKMAYRHLVAELGIEFQKYANSLTHAAAVLGHLDFDDQKQAEMLHETILNMGLEEVPLVYIYRHIDQVRGKASRRQRQLQTRVLINGIAE